MPENEYRLFLHLRMNVQPVPLARDELRQSTECLMNMSIAIVLLVAGIALVIFGLGSTDSIQNAFSRVFTGHYTERTTWMIVCGCVLVAVGLLGCYRSRRV